MKNLVGRLSCILFLACSGSLVSAQKSTIPFRQLEKNAQLSASVSVPEPESKLIIGSSGSFADPGLSAAFSYVRPIYKRERVIDSKFLLLNGLHMGLAALDIGLTQRCLASGRCREGNPFMPSSLAGQAAVGSAIASYGFFASYGMKKHGSKAWWLSPVVGIGAHSAGAVTGFINR
jgi:hypothetical protein